MKQLLLILNPTAGMKKAARNLAQIISVFNRAGYDTHVYVTTCRGDAITAIRLLGTAMDLIVCCGGDGTLNETVTGIIETGLHTPIGYIPAGSTNDFASSLGLSTNVIDAAKQITVGTTIPYDIGMWENRYFTYVASFGVFTKASYTTSQNVKNALGHIAYVLEGIQEFSTIHTEHIRMELDNEVVEDDYLFGAICNAKSLGGILTLNPAMVDMSDGKFEVLLIRGPKDIQELHECIIALKNQTYNCAMITFRSTNKLKILGNPAMPWSLDGERADGARQIQIENLHRRIMLVH